MFATSEALITPSFINSSTFQFVESKQNILNLIYELTKLNVLKYLRLDASRFTTVFGVVVLLVVVGLRVVDVLVVFGVVVL